jgi:hypothetical protein
VNGALKHSLAQLENHFVAQHSVADKAVPHSSIVPEFHSSIVPKVPEFRSSKATKAISFVAFQNLINQFSPKSAKGINRSLFNLARIMFTYQKRVGRNVTHEELGMAFDQWAINSRAFWDPRFNRDHYYAQFIGACGNVRFGIDESPLEPAVVQARSVPLPEIPGFTDERFRLLAAICRELAGPDKSKRFFLPTRKLGKLLGVNWSTIARWLIALEGLKVIQLAPGEVRKKGGIRSPKYIYLGLNFQAVEIGARAETLSDILTEDAEPGFEIEDEEDEEPLDL